MILNAIAKFLTMALSKFRNDFRRAVNRTTVSLFLTASLLTPLAVAGAQQSTDSIAPPAATEVVQAQAETLQLQKGVVSSVSLETVDDLDAMVKEYPFLAESVKFSKETFESSQQETTYSIAKAFDAETNTNLLFVSQTGPVTCGALGCTLNIYADTGEGYTKALDVLAFGEFYVGKNDDGKIAAFFCANDAYSDWSRSEWQLNGTQFEVQKQLSQVPVVNNVPICSKPATPQ